MGTSATRSAGSGNDTKPAAPGKVAAPAPSVGKEDLPKSARVTRLGTTRAQYDFGRPITLEQAAKVLFVDGKVPREAQLLPGPGANSWTLQAADAEDWQATLRKMRTRTQTVTQGKPNADKTRWNPPEPDEITEAWSDEPRPAPKGPQRRDLHNDMGFKITKNYRLDEGKSPVKHVKSPLGMGKGHGYELVFDKAATKAEVMETLFGKNNIGEDTVFLKPAGPEPATTWQVHVIGVDALTAFKRPVFRAIADANTEAPESIAPDVPKGIRSFIESKTVPKGAKSHPPDVFVWEQERYLVRVETDGKGGYYTYETTALTDSDEASNITIRYFMVEQGLKSREAWQEYIKHWDWIHMQMLTGLAMALSSGRLPTKAPIVRPRVPLWRTPTKPGAGGVPEPNLTVPAKPSKTPGATIGHANTEPAPVQRPARGGPLDDTQPMPVKRTTEPGFGPPGPAPTKPMKSPDAGKREPTDPRSVVLPDNHRITVNTAKGREQMTVGQYRQRATKAKDWAPSRAMHTPPTVRKSLTTARTTTKRRRDSGSRRTGSAPPIRIPVRSRARAGSRSRRGRRDTAASVFHAAQGPHHDPAPPRLAAPGARRAATRPGGGGHQADAPTARPGLEGGQRDGRRGTAAPGRHTRRHLAPECHTQASSA